jgi:release factor glutamine methyltransferase
VTRRLAAAGCIAAGEEAVELLTAAPDAATLDAWLARREQGEPLPWIIGRFVFCNRSYVITPGVYLPRPQSEDLAERAVAVLPAYGRAIDLCAGAGAIAAHLTSSIPTAWVIGVEIEEAAARTARANGVSIVVGDLASAIRSAGAFDVVTAVAPYVPTDQIRFLPADVQRHEPRLALDGGADGLDLVRRVVGAAATLLHAGGWLLTEVGGDQDEALAPALAAAGFDAIEPWHDGDGDLRGVAARMGPG